MLLTCYDAGGGAGAGDSSYVIQIWADIVLERSNVLHLSYNYFYDSYLGNLIRLSTSDIKLHVFIIIYLCTIYYILIYYITLYIVIITGNFPRSFRYGMNIRVTYGRVAASSRWRRRQESRKWCAESRRRFGSRCTSGPRAPAISGDGENFSLDSNRLEL